MKLSFTVTSEQKKEANSNPVYTVEHGSYVKLSSFTTSGFSLNLDFDLNLQGLSEQQAVKYTQDFANQYNKTDEFEQAVEKSKDKGGVKFILGFLSLITTGSYEKGYNSSKIVIDENSNELQTLFYEGLLRKTHSNIKISGKGAVNQKGFLNLQILTISAEDRRSLAIISNPKSGNFDHDKSERSEQKPKTIPNKQKTNNFEGYCCLPEIYSKQNNFNLKPRKGDLPFPTLQQTQSLYNYYIESLKSHREIRNSGRQSVFQFPTLQKFKNDRDYESKLWEVGSTIKYFIIRAPLFPQLYHQDIQRYVNLVREGFDQWRKTGLNLKFQEVKNAKQAHIRISFYKYQLQFDGSIQGAGSYSSIGTDAIDNLREKTMNIGHDYKTAVEMGTVVHEIGHALGLHHQHQNPNCPLKFDIKDLKAQGIFGGNQNAIRRNITDRLTFGTVWSTQWDVQSIMMYPFQEGVIKSPEKYRREGIKRIGKLSKTDIRAINMAYPQKGPHFGDNKTLQENISKQTKQIFDLLKECQKDKREEQGTHNSCTVLHIYSKQNNYNLKEIKDNSSPFPTPEQEESIYGYYLEMLQKRNKQRSSVVPNLAASSVIARPKLVDFVKSRRYKSVLWPNGSNIKYSFLLGEQWVNNYVNNYQKNMQVVRQAFKIWEETGMNLTFTQINQSQKADIRISFTDNGSSYSIVGTDCLDVPKWQPTTNYGWQDIKSEGTAIHEIGHILGLHHEQQSPNCPLIWNYEAIFDRLRGWTKQQIQHNITRKFKSSEVWYSTWDVKSIMHYDFLPNEINGPPQFRMKGVGRTNQLSQNDKIWIRKAYPRRAGEGLKDIKQIQERAQAHYKKICNNLY